MIKHYFLVELILYFLKNCNLNIVFFNIKKICKIREFLNLKNYFGLAMCCPLPTQRGRVIERESQFLTAFEKMHSSISHFLKKVPHQTISSITKVCPKYKGKVLLGMISSTDVLLLMF